MNFIELIFPVSDDFGFDERNEIEDALDLELGQLKMGYVSSAGAGLGVLEPGIELDKEAEHEPEKVIAAASETVRAFKVPKGSYLLAYPTSLSTWTCEACPPHSCRSSG